jgi:hypothetical protein
MEGGVMKKFWVLKSDLISCGFLDASVDTDKYTKVRQVSPGYDKAVENLINISKRITNCCNDCAICASCELKICLAAFEKVKGDG